MNSYKYLIKENTPSSLARLVKRVGVYPRYWLQANACARGYKLYGNRYPQKTLFVAGLPKSGTTWLERMIASYPGFHELLIPDVANYELATGGSHDYALPINMFSRFKHQLVLTKMHVHGSEHNVSLLRLANVRYVILFRDLRDVAISYYYYVRQTPWHPEYAHYAGKGLREGLLLFGQRTLADYVEWVRSWSRNRDTEASLMVSYEEMLAHPIDVMTRVASLFELDASTKTVESIVEKHSFKKLSGGRQRGEGEIKSFFRKGLVGDWRNHFDEGIRDVYKEKAGDFFVEFGYEKDTDW